ncbi:MAG: PorT family protein [Chitinophagales bacterium]|nr:PorT family protein [Chitinophagales bacterium]
MKKTILLSVFAVAITVLGSTSAFAQKGFHVGAQGAQNFTGMYNQDDADNDKFNYKATTGQTFGLSGGYNFNKHLGVAVEAMYSFEGQKFEVNNNTFKTKLSYVKVPVLFTYNTNPEAKIMFTAKAGPQIGMLTRATLKNDDGDVLIKDNKDNYENITFGAVAGAGARMNIAKNLYLDAALRLDGNFTNSEVESFNEANVERAKSYNMNAGLEVGIKYFFN